MVEMKNMYLLPEMMSKDCGAYKTADASGITIAHAQLFHIPTYSGNSFIYWENHLHPLKHH
jgi:hypothetical protein